MTKKKISSLDEYQKGLYDLLIKLGDRRYAERQLADKIQSCFAFDPALSRKERVNLLDRADGMLACRTDGFHGIKNNKLVTGWKSKCGQVRLCPDEARAEGARLGGRYIPEMKKLMTIEGMRCFYMVLTTPNVARGELRKEKRAIFSQWKRLYDRQRKASGLDIGGGTIEAAFLAQEDPLSRNGEWNVHLNTLLFVKGGFDFGKVRALWGHNVEFKELKGAGLERAMLEVVKYSVKHISGTEDVLDPDTGMMVPGAPGLADFDSAAFAEWWKAGIRFRRVRTYGALNGLADDAEDDEEADLEDQETVWMGRIRYGTRSQQYTTTWQSRPMPASEPTVAKEKPPIVDLIMVDKCGKPEPARPAGSFSESADDEIRSMDGAEAAAKHSPSADASGGSTWASIERVSTGAQPLPLTAKHQKSMPVVGAGRFVPAPTAERRAIALGVT